jgi:tetratricopeptide (TPR) repeat protein
LNQPKEQEAAWRRLRKEFPDHPLALGAAHDLAKAAFKRKDWKEAATQAKAAAASDEDGLRARALLLEGESELQLKRFKEAAKSFEGVVAVKGVEADDRYRALAGLGLAREELQDLRAALGAYEAVAAKSPDATLRDWARNRAAAIKSRLAKPSAPAGGDKRQ